MARNRSRRSSIRRTRSHSHRPSKNGESGQPQSGKSSSGKKKNKGPTEDEIIKQAGRWFARSLDPFINVKNAIVVGMKVRESAESGEEGDEEEEEDIVAPDSAEKEENELTELEDVEENPTVDIDHRSQQCFNTFIASKDQDFVNACKLLVNCDDDLTRLNKLLKALQASSNSARSDDTGKVLPDTLKLLKRDRKHTFKEPVPEHKSEFGFNHEDIARFLIPIDDKNTFDLDPAAYMEAVLNGEVSNEWWCLPLFLFDEDLVQPEKPTAGIFQGYILVRFFCHIFLGNGLPERQGKTNGRDTVATRHGMTVVTGHHIAYAATQARYCMGTAEKWQQFDGGFDLWRFFWSIVDFFEGEDRDDSADEILTWWNKEVFSTRNAMKSKEEKSSAPPPTSRYAIIQQERRQAKKLRHEAKVQEDRQQDQAVSPHTTSLSQRPAPSQQQPHPISPQHLQPSPSPQHQRPPSPQYQRRSQSPPRRREEHSHSAQGRQREHYRQRSRSPGQPRYRIIDDSETRCSRSPHPGSGSRSLHLSSHVVNSHDDESDLSQPQPESPVPHATLQRLRRHQADHPSASTSRTSHSAQEEQRSSRSSRDRPEASLPRHSNQKQPAAVGQAESRIEMKKRKARK